MPVSIFICRFLPLPTGRILTPRLGRHGKRTHHKMLPATRASVSSYHKHMTDLETAPAETSETADSSVPATMIVFYRLYGAYARTEDNLARMYLLDLAEGSRHAIEAALNTIAGAPAFALRRKQPKPFTCLPTATRITITEPGARAWTPPCSHHFRGIICQASTMARYWPISYRSTASGCSRRPRPL